MLDFNFYNDLSYTDLLNHSKKSKVIYVFYLLGAFNGQNVKQTK